MKIKEQSGGRARHWSAYLVYLILLVTPSLASASVDFCWKDSYGRGVGTIPGTCSGAFPSKEGALCYERCKPGYKTSTAGACLQECKPGYRDDGLFCRKAEFHVKEYPWNFGDPLNDSEMFKRCERTHGKGKCEKRLAVVVEKCPKGWTHVLGFCRPPVPDCKKDGYAGQFDLSCTKHTYFKTPHVASCAPGEFNDAGLCYKPCANGMKGVGPVCWAQCSNKTLPTECGAGCAKDAATCGIQTTNLVMSVLDSAVSVATLVGTLGASSAVSGLKANAKQAAKLGIDEGARITSKMAVELAGKSSIKTLASQAGKISKGTAKQLAKETLKGIVKPSDLADGAGKMASTTGNINSLIGNISDLANANHRTQAERDFMIAQEVLNNVSLLDPTGIVGVVAEYTKPVCSALASPTGAKTKSGHAGISEALLAEYSSYKKLLDAKVGIAQLRINDVKEQERALRAEREALMDPYVKNAIMKGVVADSRVRTAKRSLAQLKQKPLSYRTKDGKTLPEAIAYATNELLQGQEEHKAAQALLKKVSDLDPDVIPPSVAKRHKHLVKQSRTANEAMKKAKTDLRRAEFNAQEKRARSSFARLVEQRKSSKFWTLHPGKGYANGVNFSQAKKHCEKHGGQLASKTQLITAYEGLGYQLCANGWLADGSAGYVMQKSSKGCGRAGFNSGGKPDRNKKLGAYCVGPTLPQGVQPDLNLLNSTSL